MTALLELAGLTRRFGQFTALDGVSLSVTRGETLALVGASGSGKSTLVRCATGLIRPSGGEARFEGRLLSSPRQGPDRDARRKIAMVFQDPFSSLNPRWRVGALVAEPLRLLGLGVDQARVAAMLERVGLSAGDAARYPHQFSGGQRQRIALARALIADPELIICDEPTSALDVSVQAQILNLMRDLQRERALTLLFVTHDMAVVRFMADRIGVMDQGRLVELAPAEALFTAPEAEATRILLAHVPRGLTRSGL